MNGIKQASITRDLLYLANGFYTFGTSMAKSQIIWMLYMLGEKADLQFGTFPLDCEDEEESSSLVAPVFLLLFKYVEVS